MGRPREKWSECVMEDMNLRSACGAGSMHRGSSCYPSNPILDGKIRVLNKNDDDDDDDDDEKQNNLNNL